MFDKKSLNLQILEVLKETYLEYLKQDIKNNLTSYTAYFDTLYLICAGTINKKRIDDYFNKEYDLTHITWQLLAKNDYSDLKILILENSKKSKFYKHISYKHFINVVLLDYIWELSTFYRKEKSTRYNMDYVISDMKKKYQMLKLLDRKEQNKNKQTTS